MSVKTLLREFEQRFEDLRHKIHPELHAEADALAAKAKEIAEVAAAHEEPIVADAAKATVLAAEEAVKTEVDPRP